MTYLANAFGPGREVDVCPVCGVCVLVPYPGEPDYPQRHGRESHGEADVRAAVASIVSAARPGLRGTPKDCKETCYHGDCTCSGDRPVLAWDIDVPALRAALAPTAATQVAAAREVADTAAAETLAESQVQYDDGEWSRTVEAGTLARVGLVPSMDDSLTLALSDLDKADQRIAQLEAQVAKGESALAAALSALTRRFAARAEGDS